MKQDPSRRNMPLWLTAPIMLRDMIRRFWCPHFERGETHDAVAFHVFSNEGDLIYLVPPEDPGGVFTPCSRGKSAPS